MAQGSGRGAARSTAIVLFTDLVGSTELRSQLGEAAAEDLRRQHDTLVTGAVQGSSGTVVKNLGDGFMATFGGASDAVAAAVAVQQAIDRHNRSGGQALGVRIGVSAGDVVFENDDCFGTPVIEAARLCAAADGSQILASEIVRWMAHAGEETFTPVGSLELKGLTRPLPTVQVNWEPLAQSPVPLPTFLTDIGRIFVGRDGELDRLEQLWKEAAAGERRVAFLAASPASGRPAWPPSSPSASTTKGPRSWPADATRTSASRTSRSWRRCVTSWTTPPAWRSAWAVTAGNWPAWCPNSVTGHPAWPHRSGPTPRWSATASSTPWPPGSAPQRPRNRCSSCSTTSNGRQSRR